MTYIRPCQATKPNNCPYHGDNSIINTKALREELQVAYLRYENMSVAPQPGMDTHFESWEDYKKAEKAYYATDEGLNQLNLHLQNGSVPQERYDKVKQEALNYRFAQELESSQKSVWNEVSLTTRVRVSN